MWISLAAAEVLDREFLDARKRLIDLAAALDRIDRAEGPELEDTKVDDQRLDAIRQAVQVLAGDDSNRAERIQSLFSLPYQEAWREDYGL